MPRPRGGDWLRDDLLGLRNDGIDVLVSLLSDYEAMALGLSDETKIAEELGIHFISHPIPDRELPKDAAAFRQLVANLGVDLRAGKTVGAHCRACIGRSTVLIASVMISEGADPEEALRQITEARGLEVPDTSEQRAWILQYRAGPLIPMI